VSPTPWGGDAIDSALSDVESVQELGDVAGDVERDVDT
jgi:hypothetical protein